MSNLTAAVYVTAGAAILIAPSLLTSIALNQSAKTINKKYGSSAELSFRLAIFTAAVAWAAWDDRDSIASDYHDAKEYLAKKLNK